MIRSILSRTLMLVAVPTLILVGLLILFWQAERRQTEAQRLSLHTKEVLEEVQQLERRGVGPLQVLEHDEERAPRGERS